MEQVKAILFDVFGTVVDWRGSIIREVSAVGEKLGISGNWGRFADRWRDGYYTGTQDVVNGKREWVSADTLHLERLEILKPEFGLDGLNEEETIQLNKAWHRLDPWPDSVQGLTRLKQKYIIGSLSNGNIGLLVNMAKHAGLPWDIVLSGENFRSYKPDASVYLGAVETLGLKPHEVMIAAAHITDLQNAKKNGLSTAFIVRPDEFGDGEYKPDLEADENVDVNASDLLNLAEQLRA
ncbi:MAG: haloacid dehalogenase type II [Opitutales bacterium]|nr:haloacid dehalogenase type II [Opitutales bacterium]MDB2499562.1 haloacid dehalogenase type II [bacterium]MDG2169332.1 haloacid dehalogenase type II [Opitutales bacterium]